ncbi:MAG: FG-GAP repeat domain-containing protein [Terriglobales bacterium]
MFGRVLVFCFVTVATSTFAQNLNFTQGRYPSQGVMAAQADLNGDGILDIVSLGLNAAGKTGFYVTLSNPDGSYNSPVFYTSPYHGGTVSIALGDFNRDGKVDVAEVEGTAGYYIFLNKGNGQLLPSWNFALPSNAGIPAANFAIATADFNDDGKLDLIIFNNGELELLYGSGYGTFSRPYPFASNPYVDQIFIGDFDSDGKPDVATAWADCGGGNTGCATHLRVYYGDGRGDFSRPSSVDYANTYTFTSDDVNSDTFSDLIGVSGNSVIILHGDGDRAFEEEDITLKNDAGSLPVAADLNGDGIKDLALIEGSDVVVLLGNPDGSYQAEQTVYSSAGLQSLLAGRYNHDTKPDLVTSNMANPSGGGFFEFLRNTTTGNFPSCDPPVASAGIAICAPIDGSSVVSPVKVAVGAAFTSPLRKTEVWIDGVKVKESFNSYATYSFLDGAFTLAPGNHRADVFSAGYDNRLQLKTVYFSVGSTASLQYDVSLFPWSAYSATPKGQVTVDSAGVTTVQLNQATADTTYTVQFCAADQLYNGCPTVGSVTTNASGAATSKLSFPSGSWAGDFELVVNGTIEYATDLVEGLPSTYYATLQPETTVNGTGTGIVGGNPSPQDPLQTGSVSLTSSGQMHISLTGARPNTAYTGVQCPLSPGSDCYAVQTDGQSPMFTTDSHGNGAFTAGLISGIPEDIFYVDENFGAGFIAGFRIP